MRKIMFVPIFIFALISGYGNGVISIDSVQAKPLTTTKQVNEKIIFTEKEPEKTVSQIISLMNMYHQHLIKAINSNSFSSVEQDLVPKSKLYNAQKALVRNLYNRNIKEKLLSSEVYWVYYDDSDTFEVEVTESIEINYPDKGKVVKDYQWIYTVEKTGSRYLLSDITKWSNYAEDMDLRSGAVKADGYYISELIDAYPKILQDCLNTLDITEIRKISANENILNQHKVLITELRLKGTDFTIKSNIVSENWDTGIFTLEFTIHYIDKQKSKQVLIKKYDIQLKEIRKNFDGYAVVSRILVSK